MKKKGVIALVLGIVVILVIAVIVILTRYAGKDTKNKNKKSYDGEIVGIEYSYGSYHGGYREYEIYIKNDKTYLVAKGGNGIDLNINKRIDNSVLEDISEIIEDNKIYKWYGFDKSDKHILDGYSFSLIVKYKDGKEEKAHGYMKYPSNYEEGHKALSDYLESFK